jgi:hypothetical protein
MKTQKRAFVCQMCGHCCYGEGGIVVTQKDQERLSLYLHISISTLRDTFTLFQNDQYVLRTGDNGYCIFFDQDQGCKVHTYKPDICQAWPFFRGNLRDEMSWEMAQEYCPGIDQNLGHQEFVRQGLLYLQENDLLKDQSSIDRPKALLTKQEWNILTDSK